MAQMSGKKASKFRITIRFAVNADGSEKLAPFYIGRYVKLWCFGRQGPNERGFYYRSNKTS